VREVLTKLYSATPDGYCGDEDNGQTSAWYVFSSLGFYPVTPGSDEYVIGSPLFNKATITLKNGNKFTIKTKHNSVDNFYIQSANLNGKDYENSFLKFETIQNGGELQFNLGETPNKNWGSELENVPYSLSTE
jgi:putative alpha-1,2-mannosidase